MPSSLLRTPEGINVVRLNGKFVSSTLDELKKTLEDVPPGESVVLNFRNVNIVDSIAVGYLVNRFKLARKKGAQFKLCNLQMSVQKLLTMSDLHNWFDIHEKEEDAVASIVSSEK